MASVIKPSADKPAPGALSRDKLRMWRTIVGLFGAPAAWITQMSLCEPLAANACYPYRVPLSAPLWQSLPVVLAAISLACSAIGLLAGVAAWSMWRRARGKLPECDGQPVIVSGGRARFLAALAAMSSFVFIVAIVFTSCAILLVSPCHPWS